MEAPCSGRAKDQQIQIGATVKQDDKFLCFIAHNFWEPDGKASEVVPSHVQQCTQLGEIKNQNKELMHCTFPLVD